MASPPSLLALLLAALHVAALARADMVPSGPPPLSQVNLKLWTDTSIENFLVVPSNSLNAWSAEGNNSNDGARVQFSDYSNGFDGNVGALWFLNKVGSAYSFQQTRGTCLNVPGGSTDADTVLVIWTCNGSSNQLWTPIYSSSLDFSVQWQNVNSGLCLDATGSHNGDYVIQWYCKPSDTPDNANQLWLPLRRTILSLATPTAFNYVNFNTSSPPIMQGDTKVIANRLQLTNYNQGLSGNAFHPAPVTLLKNGTGGCEAASFNARFSFLIFNNMQACDGDGLTFTLVSSNADLSKFGAGSGQFLGYSYGGSATVGSIAVKFDTYFNYEYNEPNGRHVGILENLNPMTIASATTSILNTLSATSTKYAWVEYKSETSQWSVYFSNAKSKPAQPVLRYNKSLCSILRPPNCADCVYITSAFVGFTAATGSCYDAHQILSWSFDSSWMVSTPARPPPSRPPPRSPPLPPPPTPPPSPPPPRPPPSPPPPMPPPSPPPPRPPPSSPPPRPPPPPPSLRPPPSPPPPRSPPPRPPPRPPPPPLSPDVVALLEFKRAFANDVLSNWKLESSVCSWDGVGCTTTSPKRVNKLLLPGGDLVSPLNGTISPSIGNLAALEELDLSNNKLSGVIPNTLGQLQNLKKLTLSNNQLTGVIPASLSNLTSLTEISLSLNQLTGEMPTSFENLNSLSILNFGGNQLSGPIPASIGTLRGLKELRLSNNRFTGTIPTTFGGLLSIRSLSLAKNLLIGPIVFDFGQLEDVALSFDDNYFSGELSITVKGEPRNCAGLNLNCFADLDENCGEQRDDDSCNNFCNARQPQGACGGNGYCSYNGSQPTCTCDIGYNITSDTNTCVFGGRGFGLDTSLPITPYAKLNRSFRYATTGYLRQRNGKSSWQVAIAWNWTVEGAVQSVKDQGSCSSCWVFSTISAIESAIFIVNGGNIPTPQLAEQQLLSCSSTGKTCLSGGWPQEALDYAANNALTLASNFTGQASCGKGDNRFKITSFEQVAFNGWLGLLLILQQQPAIVNIEASSSNFINYNGGVFDDEDCFSNGVDHSVAVVGYDLSADPPFWILRNSWGQNWGEQGYMRLKISAGLGICGINSLPALMPVVKPADNDPCFTRNYASTVLMTTNGPGTMNPCGNGVCTVNGSTNQCRCSEGFVAVTNSDNSQTCAPLSPCTFAASNPCGVGTCLNVVATPGAYACACPLGYASDSPDGILTCVPAAIATGLQSFTVPAGANMSCYDIFILYGIKNDVFLAQNKRLNCLLPLPGGTVVNVTNNYGNCSVVYAVNEGDTCEAIAAYFNVTSIYGPGSPNPDLSCSQLRPFQQVCIQRGALVYPGPCTKPYDVQPEESCFSIIRNELAGDIKKFYTLNPGVYCGKLLLATSSSASIGQHVCLEAANLGASAGCSGNTYTLKAGDKCASLKKCFNKKESLKKLNSFPCTASALKKMKAICVPKTSACA